MIKLHGFGGPSEFWDYNLESLTLMARLAAVTSRIRLFVTTAVLTIPPAIAARMVATIDSIAPSRFGVKIISGWQRAEYTQMDLWPGAEHHKRRYDFCAEYVAVMRERWSAGRSDLKGGLFRMEDCRLSPRPSQDILIICAAQSDAGTAYAAQYAGYNVCNSFGINKPTSMAPSVARLVAANARSGRKCGALIPVTIIADETDGVAQAKWDHDVSGTDHEALAWRDTQASDDPSTDPMAQPNKCRVMGDQALPTSHGVRVGSYSSIARMLDEMLSVLSVEGVMMTFDDFVIGMEAFGTRILPLLRCRQAAGLAA